MASKFNPLSSFNYSYSNGSTNNPLNNFTTRLSGIIRAFTGNLSTPENELPSKAKQRLKTNTYRKSRNHLGIFDYITLGILYLLESFSRGNWIHSPNRRLGWLVLGALLGWTYVAAVTVLLRYIVGLACGLILFIPLGMYHAINKAYVHKTVQRIDPKAADERERLLTRPSPEQNAQDLVDYQTFLWNYIQVKNAFKNIPFDALEEEQAAWKRATLGYHVQALAAVGRMSNEARLATPNLAKQKAMLMRIENNYTQDYLLGSKNLNDLRETFPLRAPTLTSTCTTITKNQAPQADIFKPNDFQNYQEFLTNYHAVKDAFKPDRCAQSEGKNEAPITPERRGGAPKINSFRSCAIGHAKQLSEKAKHTPGFFQKCVKLGMYPNIEGVESTKANRYSKDMIRQTFGS